MNPDDVTDQAVPDAQTAALAKLLAEQLAHEGQPATDAAAEPTMFGMTTGGIFVAFVVSTVGLGLMNYGRSTSSVTFAGFGLAMITVPFFLTNTVVVGVVGLLLLLTPIVMRRLHLA
jgi:hypothetical protein